MVQPLSYVVGWAHQLLGEVLSPGGFAIDLTAGNGYDTLELAHKVGETGRVLAFDLQPLALQNSTERLQRQGIAVSRLTTASLDLPVGASLVQANHAELAAWCKLPAQAVIANLGYLPGGDKRLITKPESTLAALRASCELLAVGGRLAVVVYAGHLGGSCEAEAVEVFFAELDEQRFEVLRLEIANRKQAPFLLTAGKLI